MRGRNGDDRGGGSGGREEGWGGVGMRGMEGGVEM